MRSAALNGVTDDLLALANEAPSVVSSILSAIRRLKPILPTVQVILNDPGLYPVVERIKTLHEIEASHPSAGSSSSGPVGIGLQRFVKPLDMLIYARRNPWAPWVVLGGIVGLIGLVGFRLGQRRA